jgi:hypothetical protein
MINTVRVLFIILLFSFLSLAQEAGRDLSQTPGNFNNPEIVYGPLLEDQLSTLSESFEDPTFPPTGWLKLNPDGGTGWDRVMAGTTPIPGWNGGVITTPPGGGSYVAFATWNTGGAVGNDQWIVTPQITNVQAGDELSFWLLVPGYTNQTYLDSVDILISTTGTAVADFNVVVEQLFWPAASPDTNWTQYTYTLTNFVSAGSDIYIAWREHVSDNLSDGAAVCLDLVEVTSGSGAVEKLLLTEFVVTPTAGEFIEIFNPNATPVDLTDYFLSDVAFDGGPEYYYHVVQGLYGGGFGDFNSQFPNGASIGAGEHQIIALNGDADFFSTYGVNPTYEIDLAEFQSGIPDGIPDMMETHPGSIYGADSTHNPGLTNGDEMIMLYYWDGMTDLVGDVDYVLYNSASPTPNDEAVDKTGVTIDGPDPGTTGSTYLNDTPVANQLSALSPTSGFSAQRFDYAEGLQVMTGGNGVTGSDETSEDMNNTWIVDVPTPFVAIPVELTSFTANVVNETIVLYWSTATETNNLGFEVEKRAGNEYRAVGFVNGFGTTTQPQDYTFVDDNAEIGSNYYRLKQVDFDGSYSYSNEIEVDFSGPVFYSLEQNYPNPFNPSTKIVFNLAADSKVTLKVFDVLGQESANLISSQLDAGKHELTFDASLFNSGVYFYRIDAEGIDGSSFTQVKKMLLTK